MTSYSLEWKRYRLPFRTVVRTAHGIWAEREGLLVKLEAEAGAVGYGEAAPIPWFGSGTVDEAEAAVRALGAQVTGETLEAAIGRGGVVGFALGAARAEVCNVMRYKLASEAEAGGVKGGRHDYLPVAALLPAGKGTLGVVDGLAEVGFRTFKWKVGVAAPREEWGLLDDLLAELPEGAKVRLDANGAWSRREAEAWLARTAERPMIEFVEQPVAADGRGADDVLRGLAEDYPTPIALDESLATPGDLVKWSRAGWTGVWVVKSVLLGDPAETLATLRGARADVVWSSALETVVGMRAGLRMALDWTEGKRAVGYGAGPLFDRRALNGPPAVPFVRSDEVAALDAAAAWAAADLT